MTSLARVAGQQGVGNTLENAAAPAWRIEFEARAKWQNPLQGWNSTADPLENVGRSSLFFFTKEQAVAYAQKAGWEVEVVEPQVRRKDRQKRFNSYGDNYTSERTRGGSGGQRRGLVAGKAGACVLGVGKERCMQQWGGGVRFACTTPCLAKRKSSPRACEPVLKSHSCVCTPVLLPEPCNPSLTPPPPQPSARVCLI